MDKSKKSLLLGIGVIIAIVVLVGLIGTGSPVMSLLDMSDVWFSFSIREDLLGSFCMLTVSLALYVMAQQLMGVLLAGLVPDMHLSVCVAAIYGMLAFTMSGFSYPVTSMPPFIQGFSILFPLRQYYLCYVDIALYGCGVGYYWSHLAILLAYMAFGLLGGFMLNKEYRKEPQVEQFLQFESPQINGVNHKDTLLRRWFDLLRNVWDVMLFELRNIFTDAGVLLLFFVASLLYPLLFSSRCYCRMSHSASKWRSRMSICVPRIS